MVVVAKNLASEEVCLLENNIQALRAPDEAIVLDNVGMVEVLEQVNLHFHVLQVGHTQVLQPDLLDGDRLARAPIQRAVHATKGPLAQAIPKLKVLEACHILGCPLCRSFSARPLLSLTGLARLVRGCRRLLCMAGRVGLRRWYL
jgi:hypothetical protein